MDSLRVSGTNVPNQTVTNLVAGANITLTVDQEMVTIASAGLPSGSANLVLATPNGSSGTASLRALVVADLPSPLDIGTF